MARCTGHCCKRFALKHSYEELQREYALWERDPKAVARIADVGTIAPMVIPVASSADGSEHVYTCKHLGTNGDCAIYERRPQMCRDFPDEEVGCHFRGCTSSQSAYYGVPWWRRVWVRWKWLRGLSRER